jgi:hypothetical protein
MLTPAEVQELRAVQESAMAETCVIRDPSHKTSGKGQEWSSPGGGGGGAHGHLRRQFAGAGHAIGTGDRGA